MNINTNLIWRRFQPYLQRHSPDPVYAIRNTQASYLSTSPKYLDYFAPEESRADILQSLDNFAFDLPSQQSILAKDQQALTQASPTLALETFIINNRLVVLEVYRYPLIVDQQVVALGVVAEPLSEKNNPSASEISHYLQTESTPEHPQLSHREWLIGLLLLLDWNAIAIATHLGISKSRLNQIFARICRYRFWKAGAATRYRQLLIETGMYKNIPLDLLLAYVHKSSSVN
ncbi:MAG: hypothetical protein K2X04_03075 [Burkholderiales bacterium]|nr:hypothetical protein [Burkholderiales bacterium]